MGETLYCPGCGQSELDISAYDALMVVHPDVALFTLTCPLCGHVMSTLQPIPDYLREELRRAAQEVNAGGYLQSNR